MRWQSDRIRGYQDRGFGHYAAAARLQQAGADVIHLEVGRPSFDSPVHVKEAAKQALDAGIVHYGDLQGEPELRSALVDKLADYNRLQVSPDEVLVTNGLTQAAFATLMAYLNPGDQAVVLEPFYPQHPSKISLLQAELVTCPLAKTGKRFALDPEVLESAITNRTKLIVFVNPANPTGTVFTPEEVAAVAAIAERHDLLVLTDEVYEYVVYDGHRHTSLAALPGMRQRTISTFAFTKAYAMDGWRLGYVVACRELLEPVMKVTLNETTHPCIFAQKGAYAAVAGGQECVAEMVEEDRRRRDFVVGRLNRMPGVECYLPEGTIYAFPDFSSYGIPSEQLSAALLQEAHVATEPGTFYGPAGEGHLRLCFGSETLPRLGEALDRVEDFLARTRLGPGAWKASSSLGG